MISLWSMNGNKRYLHSFAEARHIDNLNKEAGIPEKQLMGQAALSSFYAIRKYITKIPGRISRILILCGPGNNGGDALALAHLLLEKSHLSLDIDISIFTSAKAKNASASFYAGLLKKLNYPIKGANEFLREKLLSTDLIIEGLLGTGQSSKPRGIILEMLLHIRRYRLNTSESKPRDKPHLISLDLPAGLSEKDPSIFISKHDSIPLNKKELSTKSTSDCKQNTAEKLFLAAPDEIHCYGIDKSALYLSASIRAYTRIRLLHIGFINNEKLPLPKYKLAHFNNFDKKRHQLKINNDYNSDNILYKDFYRDPSAHKYAGHGLLLGGSSGMEGAAIMVANSFFAAGGGILHIMSPEAEKSHATLVQALPTAIFPNETDLPQRKPNCILIGPGLSEKDCLRMQDVIEKWIKESHPRTYFILDASATKLVFKLNFPCQRTILLAHTGEWKALGGLGAIQDTASLERNIDFYQKTFKYHLCIKDSISLLLSMKDNEIRASLFSQPNPALSVAGSGDNLAGILLSLFSRTHMTSNSDSAQYKILLCLKLLYQALENKLHPRSDTFPEAIERLLKKSRNYTKKTL